MQGRTVVVVEDEEVIAGSLAARLRAEGFRVELAHDGPGGVELCRNVRPDVVVLDVMLPGFDGLEVCRRVQALRPVPILMLTARDAEADVLVGLGVGADDYVTKPAWIARRNVERYERTGHIDSSYLAVLSSDAVDALLRLPDGVEGCPLAGARAGLSRHGVFGLNLSRAHARHVLAGGQGPC